MHLIPIGTQILQCHQSARIGVLRSQPVEPARRIQTQGSARASQHSRSHEGGPARLRGVGIVWRHFIKSLGAQPQTGGRQRHAHGIEGRSVVPAQRGIGTRLNGTTNAYRSAGNSILLGDPDGARGRNGTSQRGSSLSRRGVCLQVEPGASDLREVISNIVDCRTGPMTAFSVAPLGQLLQDPRPSSTYPSYTTIPPLTPPSFHLPPLSTRFPTSHPLINLLTPILRPRSHLPTSPLPSSHLAPSSSPIPYTLTPFPLPFPTPFHLSTPKIPYQRRGCLPRVGGGSEVVITDVGSQRRW